MVTRMQERNSTVGWTLMTPGHRFCPCENRVSRYRFDREGARFTHRLQCKASSNRLNIIISRKPCFQLWKSVTKISSKWLACITIVNFSAYFLLGITNNSLLPVCLFYKRRICFIEQIQMFNQIKNLLSFKG